MTKKTDKDMNGGHLSKDPPDYLGRQAKVVWRRIVPFLEDQGSINRADTGLVEMYATQYELYRTAYKDIQQNGSVREFYKTVVTPKGEVVGKDLYGIQKNPSLTIYNDALKNLTKLSSELGLSPKGRGELLKLVDGDSDDDIDWGEKFGGD